MILVIDNYDSFTFNLAHMVEAAGQTCRVVRNDKLTVTAALEYKAIILSPGPARPEQAGVCVDLIRTVPDDLPILGVCLGHQALGTAYGAKVERTAPVHGRASLISHDQTDLFNGIPNPMTVARYHSLCVTPDSLPDELVATAWTSDGVLMAMQHAYKPQFGVQFHPESIVTAHGARLIRNFLDKIQ